MKIFKTHYFSFCLVCLLIFSVNVHAQITSLCDMRNPCSASGTVTPGVVGTVSISWRGEANVERDDAVVASQQGRFITANNQALGTISSPLNQRLLPNAIGAPVSFTLNETLSVPVNVSQRAAALGLRQLTYARAFTFDGLTLTGNVTINLNQISPNSSTSIPEGYEPDVTAVGINRFSLRFSSGSQTEIIRQNQSLRAIATINFERAGMLDAIWEVATPASTSGQAIFKPLQNVRQYLAASRQVDVQSPVLPSDEPGIYRLRLRLLQPTLSQAPVELRYQVNKGSGKSVVEIGNVSPPPGAVIDAQSEFSWQAQAGVKAWQLEIYERADAQQPLTGMLVQGEQNHSPLSASVLGYLEPGRIFYWRVVAVDMEGEVIAASEMREIRMQK